MKTPKGPEQRRFERIHLPHGKLVCHGVDTTLDGDVTVLGLGGMYIRTPKIQAMGAQFSVRLRNIADVVEAQCTVRGQGLDGMGVEFVSLQDKHQANLQRIIDRLKSESTGSAA
ncbi:MAG: PilZ domain-containing protein [Acidobacteriales bacterium]|nr:PilZ domain-containing protein [Terriglobales bacterium]